MPRYKEIDRGMRLLPIDLSVPLLPGTTSNWGCFQNIFPMQHSPHSGTELVQQTVRISASLRSLDLTLFVMRHRRWPRSLFAKRPSQGTSSQSFGQNSAELMWAQRRATPPWIEGCARSTCGTQH
jgi:hypothetical protein